MASWFQEDSWCGLHWWLYSHSLYIFLLDFLACCLDVGELAALWGQWNSSPIEAVFTAT